MIPPQYEAERVGEGINMFPQYHLQRAVLQVEFLPAGQQLCEV